jgi:hypothetical protein
MYKTTILPPLIYGCETWCLTLWEEQRFMLFENRMLRRIFGPMREGVPEGWIRLHNEELHNLYASPNIVTLIKSRSMRWTRNVARMGDVKCVHNCNRKT